MKPGKGTKKFSLTHYVPVEYEEQKVLAGYLDSLKEVLWTASMTGAKVTPRIWKTMFAIGVKPGFPDIMIYEQRGGYVGLAIELKRINWQKPTSPREKRQSDVLEELRKRGWKASFQAGAYNAIREIEMYLRNGELNPIKQVE